MLKPTWDIQIPKLPDTRWWILVKKKIYNFYYYSNFTQLGAKLCLTIKHRAEMFKYYTILPTANSYWTK